MEIWKPVVGFEEYYSVSNTGRVRREKGGSGARVGRLVKPNITQPGYFQAMLSINNHTRPRFIHRLVLTAFIGPCPPELEANHKDGNKANNCLENLEWVTCSENNRHALATGLRTMPKGAQHWGAKLTEDNVREIRRLCAEGLTRAEVGRRYGVCAHTISRIVLRQRWKHVE